MKLLRLFQLVLSVLLLWVMQGCTPGNCPELITYREGLHPLDQAIYQQATQATQDLVTSGQRTQNDLSALQFEINQAESHYNTSKQGDAKPTTQPSASPAPSPSGTP